MHPEVIITVVATSALLPFIQSLATKAAEDVGTKLRRTIARSHDPNLKDHLAHRAFISLADEATKVVLDLPAALMCLTTPTAKQLRQAIAQLEDERTFFGRW